MRQRVEFDVPAVRHLRQVTDLCTSLLAITGVSNIDVDEADHKVRVDYDPDYVSITMLENCIRGTGYPIRDTKDEG